MTKRKKAFPKEILVYQVDEVEGHPVYAVVNNVNDIEADCDGQRVGVYSLNTDYQFNVRRELK